MNQTKFSEKIPKKQPGMKKGVAFRIFLMYVVDID